MERFSLEPSHDSPGALPENPESSRKSYDKSYSVTQYNLAVERYLKNKVPQTWVHGVITQLNVRGRVTYITLGQFDEGSPRPLASLQVFLWTSSFDAFNAKFSQLSTPFLLKADLKVSFLLQAAFYVPLGKFQPRVVDVDASFTVGELALTRQKILEALRREGLLQKNKSLTLSQIPLRVGLITAPGSAAYRDFTTTLEGSGFSFQIYFHPAKMQGEETELTVLQALKFLSGKSLDVICLVRGGGAKTDLVYFDSEKICRAIAGCSVPVVTGIGHEIDASLADRVSYRNCITPTDSAKFLQERLETAWDALMAVKQSLEISWREGLYGGRQDVCSTARAVVSHWHRRRVWEAGKLKGLIERMAARWKRTLAAHRSRQVRQYTGLSRGPLKLILPARQNLVFWRRQLKSHWRQTEKQTRDQLRFSHRMLQALDPKRLLDRGFAWVRDDEGRIVKTAGRWKANDKANIQMKGGVVETRVLKVKEER